MGRQAQGNRSPFRFILNHSKATAPNVYLMLYPKYALKKKSKTTQSYSRLFGNP
jgi:hypothetical protein